MMRIESSEIMIQRNSLPTPMMPPTLVSRVRGSMVRWEELTSTSLSKVTNTPYLGQLNIKVHLDHQSKPVVTLIKSNAGCLVPCNTQIGSEIS